MLFLNPAYPATLLFGLRISALFNEWTVNFHASTYSSNGLRITSLSLHYLT